MDHPRQILKLEGLTEVLDLGIANLAAATLGAQPHDIKESHLRHKPQPPQISTCSAWEVKNWRVSSWRVDNGLGLQIFQDDRRWVIVQPKTSGANLQQVCKLKCLQKTSKNYPWSNFIYWIYLRRQWKCSPTRPFMPLASEGSKIMAAILDWWYTPENERLQPKNKHHPIEKKRETMKNHGKKEKPNKSPRKYHLPSTSFFGFQPCPTASPTADCRLPCHLWCWHGANLTWKTAAGQGEISKFWPWKWEYSTYSSPLIVAIFHKNDKMWVK